MFRFMKYGPYICIGVILAILFVLWAFWGGQNYEFVGLAPLSPDTCGSYTGSFYNWGNITPAENTNLIPTDIICAQETNDSDNQTIIGNDSDHHTMIDNTPIIPSQFLSHDFLITDPASSFRESHQDSVCLREQYNNNSPIPNHEMSQQKRTSDDSPLPILTNNNVDLAANQLASSNPIQGESIQQRNPIISFAQQNPPVTKSTIPHPQQRGRRGRFLSRGERLCCQTMERIYGAPFVSTWPNWLLNPETGRTLELDCYNDELKIAVEYNGEQHYKWPNFTNQTYQQFINQVRRDTLKLDLCDKNGVYLIVVPYNVSYDNIPSYIMSHLPETIQRRLQEEQTLFDIVP